MPVESGGPASVAGFRLSHHESVGSTMDEAAALARSGDPGGVWVVADRQTGGRGRQGRVWASEAGNLHATLLLVDPCPIARAPQLGFVTGLALCDALRGLTDTGDRIRLKWPNDVLADGAKLAGVLLEGLSLQRGGERRLGVAIGCGVNVRHHPSDTPYPTTDVTALGALLQPLDVLQALSRAFRRRLDQWREGENFSATRMDWLKVAAGLGSPIRVILPDRTVDGLFSEIDHAGRLVVDVDGEKQTIDAGDVVLRREGVSP